MVIKGLPLIVLKVSACICTINEQNERKYFLIVTLFGTWYFPYISQKIKSIRVIVIHHRIRGYIKTDKMVTKKEVIKSNEIKKTYMLQYCANLHQTEKKELYCHRRQKNIPTRIISPLKGIAKLDTVLITLPLSNNSAEFILITFFSICLNA